MRRRVAILAASAAAIAIALVALLHTPPVRVRVFTWVIAQLETRYGLTLAADAFRYNLVTGTVALENVRLAARGAVQPFFTATRVRVDLPLSAYAGRLILDDVEVDSGRLEMLTDANGVSNLPPSDPNKPPPANPRSLNLRGLHLRDFAFVYDDRSLPIRVTATGIDAALDHRQIRVFDGVTGPFAVKGGIDVQFEERALRIEPIDSRLAFDGRTVSMQELPIVTSIGRLALSGRINDVLDAVSLELEFAGPIDVAQAAAWAPPPMAVSGTARVQGTLHGPLGTLDTVVRFDSDALTVGEERGLTVSGEFVIDRQRLASNRIAVSPASGGQVNALIDVPFGDAPFSANANWQGVDARVFLRVGELDPPAIGTRLDGTAQYASGPRRRLVLKTDASAITERGLTPLAGRVLASIDGSRLSLQHTLRTDGVTADGAATVLLDDDFQRSSLTGASRVVLSSLAAADRALAPHDLRVPEAVRDVTGAIEAEVELAGTIASPGVTVHAVAPDLDLPGLGPAAVTADVDATARRVIVAPFTLQHGTTDATGDVTIDLDARTLTGTAHATTADARELQGAVPDAWRLSGALTTDATLGGTLDAPFVDVTAVSPSVVFAGDTFEDLEFRGRIAGEGVEVTWLGARQEGGRLDAFGRYGFDRSFALKLDLTEMAWSGVLAGDAESRVSVGGEFNARGTLDDPVGAGEFSILITGGLTGDIVGGGTLDLALADRQARISAHIPSLGAFANGTVAVEAPYEYRGVAVLNRLDLARITPLLNADAGSISGQLSATATANGALGSDAPPQVEANLQQLDAQVAGVPLSLVSPAAISWTPGDVTVKDFAATLGTSTILAYGTWAGRANSIFSGSFRGELSEVVTAAGAFGYDTEMVTRGWVSLDLYATGNRAELFSNVNLSNGYLQATEGLVFTDLNLNAVLKGEELTLDAISGHLDAARASGAFAGKGTATIPDFEPLRAVGTFALDQASFDTSGIQVKQSRPSTITVKNGVVSMEDVVWEAAGSALAFGGDVDVTGDSPALNLSLTGVAVLRVLAAFVPGVGFDGTANVDVRIGGTTATPDLSGGIDLRDAEIALSSPRLVISELTGPIRLSGNRIELQGLTGVANGGQVAVDGGVVLEGTAISQGEFYVQASGVALEYPRGLRSEVDALLTYNVNGPTPLLSGDVRVQRSAYTDPISLAALARANSAAVVRPATGESTLDAMRLNIAISTVDDMRVDNNYGRFEGGAQLRIVGTVGQPGMSGQVALREGGTIYAAGRTFTLTRGTISFTNLNRVEPDLDIQAETSLAGQGTVSLTLQGTPDRFTFELASDAGGSEEEIATALFGGGVSGANALTLLSSDLLGVTGRQLGLDALRIDRGDVVRDEFREDPSALLQDTDDPVTRLTLSKRLRDDIEFTLSQNLRENGKTTYVVSYFPLRNLELRAISRDDATLGLGLRHQIIFGADRPGGGSVERPVQRVSGVHFQGEPAPFSLAELEQEVDVKTGEPFEYYTWQKDLDKLTALYVDRGYYEARVRGRRDETEAGLVDVVYLVDRGSATRIVVDGIALPKRELDAMREMWTRAVFDRFVVQDAEARVQRHLHAAGFVSGKVDGEMELADGQKTLRLEVTPGPPSSRRTVRFEGNAGVPTRDLEAVMAQADLELQGWIDRTTLGDTLTAYYRNQGFLEAEVTVGAPALEGESAVLPVRIEEGPRAVIREVRWTGVSDARLALVKDNASLQPQAPYTLAAVDTARDHVERHYRSLGFNSVQVAATAVPILSGSVVDVEFAVTEGAQEILKEVVTSGTTRTREGVLTRALRLRVGQPANAEEWALARKRVYDTNVFRTVDIQSVPIGDPVDGVQPVQAHVTVEEYPPWRLRYGLQVDRERENRESASVDEQSRFVLNLGAIGEVRNQNVFGRAITAGVATRIEQDFQRVNTFLQNASFFGLPLRTGLFLYASSEDLKFDGETVAVEQLRGISLEQRWRRRRGVEITYGYRYEFNHTYNPNALPDDPFSFQDTNTARVTVAGLLDRRDDPADSRRGTFSSASLDHASDWLGSDASYWKILAQQYAFFTTGPVVLASRAIGGTTFGSDNLTDGFQAGGATTVRGYAENSLGATDIFGDVIGGDQLLIFNQELRFPVYRWVRGVAFVDAGNTFSELQPFAFGDLAVGYGAGLRLSSPIGLLRLDFGIPARRSASDRANAEGRGRWYFGLGHIF